MTRVFFGILPLLGSQDMWWPGSQLGAFTRPLCPPSHSGPSHPVTQSHSGSAPLTALSPAHLKTQQASDFNSKMWECYTYFSVPENGKGKKLIYTLVWSMCCILSMSSHSDRNPHHGEDPQAGHTPTHAFSGYSLSSAPLLSGMCYLRNVQWHVSQ